MTNHRLKPQPTPQEMMERKRKRKAERKPPATNHYLAQKYGGLNYDYGQIDEAQRAAVQTAALEIRRRLKRSVEDVIEIGRQLIEVKAILPHGKFAEWLSGEFGLTDRSARNFMYTAEQFGGKSEIISVLSVTTVYLLAAPSTPDTVRWEVLERVELTDWRPTRRDIQKLISDEKPQKPLGIGRVPPGPKGLPGTRQLPAPAELDAIEAEYTILHVGSGQKRVDESQEAANMQNMPKDEFVFPARREGEPSGSAPRGFPDEDHVAVAMHRDLAKKLQDALVNRIFRVVLNRAESDELRNAITRALGAPVEE